jgi:hypothetical protein
VPSGRFPLPKLGPSQLAASFIRALAVAIASAALSMMPIEKSESFGFVLQMIQQKGRPSNRINKKLKVLGGQYRLLKN